MNSKELKTAIVNIFKEAEDNENLIKQILWYLIDARRAAHRHYLYANKSNYGEIVKTGVRKEFFVSKSICKFIIDLYKSSRSKP